MLCNSRSCGFSVLAIILLCNCVRGVSADKVCYTQGGVFGIVFATMIATLVMCVIGFFAQRHFWKSRGKGKSRDEFGVVEGGKEKFAYDNPYFQEEDGEKKNPILRNDSDSSIKKDPATQIDGSEKSQKLKNGKVGPFSNLLFTNPGNKTKPLDNSFMSLEPDIISVPLRGHDFSGLGFNITGNMRDGIFVKDVLHRGPASESGQLKIGDRILSVTVSFSSMVYEDALTILSYASPYDVSLELKKAGRSNIASHEKKGSMSSNDIMAVGNSLSASSDRLHHPLYRSKSIDDLTQIGKDPLTGELSVNGGIPPKRSLSIGTPVNRRRKENMQKIDCNVSVAKPRDGSSRRNSNNSGTSGDEKQKGDMLAQAPDVVISVDKEDEKNQTKEPYVSSVVEITGDPDKSSVIVKTAYGSDIVENVTDIEVQPKNETKIDIPDPDEVVIIIDTNDKEEHDKKSRKKGKAPMPPTAIAPGDDSTENRPSSRSSSSSSSSEEASFKDANDTSTVENPSLITAQGVSFEPDSLEKTDYHPAASTLSRKSSSSSVSDDSLEGTDSLRRKSSQKSSSLGDIPKAEDVVSGTDSLERATSLDLKKDPVPEGAIGEQNKHLKRKAPNPPPFTSSSDDTLPSEQQLIPGDSIESPDDLIYKASMVEVVDEDSLEIPLRCNEEDVGDPDSLEVASDPEEITFESTFIRPNMPDDVEPEQRSRKSSSSSSSSSDLEKPNIPEDTPVKVKVSVPADILKDVDHSSSGDEEPTKAEAKQFSPKENPTEKVELARKSSSSSASDKEDKDPPKIELSRKSSSSSSSSSSSKEDEPADEASRSRKSSSSSVSSVEETILRSVRKPIEAQFFPLDNFSDEDESPPERKVVSADDVKLDSTLSSSESEPSLNEYSINEPPSSPTDDPPDIPTSVPPAPVSESPEVKVAIAKSSSDVPSLNLPIIPPLITTPNSKTPESSNPQPKAEVIEISQQELDDVMMTHEQFMKKQASKQKDTRHVKGDNIDMSFEDWSILSSRSGDLNSLNGNTTYSPSFETNISIDGGSSQPVVTNTVMKNDPEVVKIVTSSNIEPKTDPQMPQLKTVQ